VVQDPFTIVRAKNAESRALGAIRFIRVFAQLNVVVSQETMIMRIWNFSDAHVARSLRRPLNTGGRQVAPELHSTKPLFRIKVTAFAIDVLKRNPEKNAGAARKRRTDHQVRPI
jgi:hypothetical protein